MSSILKICGKLVLLSEQVRTRQLQRKSHTELTWIQILGCFQSEISVSLLPLGLQHSAALENNAVKSGGPQGSFMGFQNIPSKMADVLNYVLSSIQKQNKILSNEV